MSQLVKVYKDLSSVNLKVLGKTSGGGASFDPATLPLTMWQRDYSGLPWLGTASAGTSAIHSFATAGSDMTVGSLNGHGVAVYGPSKFAISPDDVGDIISASASTVVALVKLNAFEADSAAWYAVPSAIMTNVNQTYGVTFSDLGAMLGSYDGLSFSYDQIAMSGGNYHLVQFTHDGVNIRGRVDGGAFQSAAKGPTIIAADNFQTGTMYNHTLFLDGEVAEIMVSDTVLSDTDLDNIKGYVNTRYGLAL
jgi:hypothetical protein